MTSYRERLESDFSDAQPQEGTPQNTLTGTDVDRLSKALPSFLSMSNGPSRRKTLDIFQAPTGSSGLDEPKKDWHGAPSFPLDDPELLKVREFRRSIRNGSFDTPTNGQCPGFLQCNLVVLREGKESFDFLLFCMRNKQACPLIEVCDVGSADPSGVAQGADLRTDLPKYCIYRDGILEKEVTDVREYWPSNSVAFLIGCSFTFETALIQAGIPLRSNTQQTNVPMYRTNLACRPAGDLKGNMVVSMRPIKSTLVSKEVSITGNFPHAHGSPVSIGCPESIGIDDVNSPDWGDTVEVKNDELPVFHACGVTPQNVLMESKVSFAITHKAGHMFVTDLHADTVL